MKYAFVVALVLASLVSRVMAQAPSVSGSGAQVLGPNQVVVSGTVPDEATRVQVLSRLRDLYGADRVVDQMALGAVVAPPQWSQHLHKLLSPSLKQVTRGQLNVQGNLIDLKGEVPNESVRQQVASDMAASLNPTYTVRNGLRVAAQEQAIVDQTLANRIIEFEAGSAVLRPAGMAILDEMAQTLAKLKGKKVEVLGHTDAQGGRVANVALSLARAQAVKTYLVGKGLLADSISTAGLGPDRPVASNATDEGRARNRRIEFQVVQ
ncbi:MAG: OmpA family protein [Burkholderiales bacterium]|nr:OmpA family protein [Burkholderiales bacterium]